MVHYLPDELQTFRKKKNLTPAETHLIIDLEGCHSAMAL